jgi:membrane protein DedA with SNARE-associated domain
MSDAILNLLDGVMTSPWLYAALFALAAIDGFLPIVPSETLAISAGVYAAAGDTTLVAVIAAAALGAFAGDHLSFFAGRRFGRRLVDGAAPGSRRAAGFGWARTQLAERGGSIIIACRYIPGARTATTLTAGAVGHPLRSFSTFDAIAAVSWGAYTALVGYLGGTAFEDSPLLGVGVGLGIALGLSGAVELVRHLRRHRRVAAAVAGAGASTG